MHSRTITTIWILEVEFVCIVKLLDFYDINKMDCVPSSFKLIFKNDFYHNLFTMVSDTFTHNNEFEKHCFIQNMKKKNGSTKRLSYLCVIVTTYIQSWTNDKTI